MSDHEVVSVEKHKDLRVSQIRSNEMGDGIMASFTFPGEFRKLQSEYPILFQLNAQRDEYNCCALLGFENNENLFLKNNEWDSTIIPLSMDIQPFLIGRSDKNKDEKTIVIDTKSKRISKDEGLKLFEDNDQPTDYLKEINKRLSYLDGGFQQAQHYLEALKKYDLLEPLSIDIKLDDGSNNRLIGFHAIHEEKFQNLEKEAFFEFQQEGWLLPTYMTLASLSNLSKLIDRKNNLSKND